MPSSCGMFRYRAFTSMVARVQLEGIVLSSRILIMSVLSLRYNLILETNGCSVWSTRRDTFSVGPPQPHTIGLTAIGFLWIFLRK